METNQALLFGNVDSLVILSCLLPSNCGCCSGCVEIMTVLPHEYEITGTLLEIAVPLLPPL